MKISKHLPAVLALSIPAAFILVLLFAVYLPSRLYKVPYSFAYSISKQVYAMPMSPRVPPPGNEEAPQFKVYTKHFIYDAGSKSIREISDDDFKKLTFYSSNEVAPVIATDDYGSYNSDIFTEIMGDSSRYSPAVYLEYKNIKRKLFNINYGDTFTFEGWIK